MKKEKIGYDPMATGPGGYPVNHSYVCWKCRLSVKRPPQRVGTIYRCGECRQPLRWCGKNFKPPKRTDTKGWSKARDKFGG